VFDDMNYLPPGQVQTLCNLCRSRQVVLFTGSGLSRPLFPSWEEFVGHAEREARIRPPEEELTLDERLQLCRKRINNDGLWQSFLKREFARQFTESGVSANYKLLRDLGVRQIVTSNYDRIPRLLWPNADHYTGVEADIRALLNSLRPQADLAFVLFLHGEIHRPETMVVTAEDYDRILASDTVREFLNALLLTKTILFVGFGWKDPHIKRAMERFRRAFGSTVGAYAVLPNLSKLKFDTLIGQDVAALGYPASGDDHSAFEALLRSLFDEPVAGVPRARERPETSQPVPQAVDPVGVANLPGLPLLGRTRLIYTCRAGFPDAPFVCPSIDNPVAGGLAVYSHIPVDELELSAFCSTWFAEQLFDRSEMWVKEAMLCSRSAEESIATDEMRLPRPEGEIDERLLDNLIVLGENVFSTRLLHSSEYFLPWRHRVHSEEASYDTPIVRGERRFRVWLSLSGDFGHKTRDEDSARLSRPEWASGLIALAPNPYAPDKRVLYITGCHRAGQDLLLYWLKSAEAREPLRAVTALLNRQEAPVVQIVVMSRRDGRSLASGADADDQTMHADWRPELVTDTSAGAPLPYFARKSHADVFNSKPGDDIADLSLLGMIPDNTPWIADIRESLPPELQTLFDKERLSDEGGMHVTLYEFLHTRGFDDQGLVSSLLNDNGESLQHLKACLAQSFRPQLVARQARLTSYSLQVLVDLFQVPVASTADVIRSACQVGCETLQDQRYRGRFNVRDIPVPLHVTLLRFDRGREHEAWKAAERWAAIHRRHIWGKTERLGFSLAGIFRFPYGAVTKVKVR
jgi:hypothetical protein